jgi:2-C-methyl-D-erythritol 4-phosphate cytidylyltransferase
MTMPRSSSWHDGARPLVLPATIAEVVMSLLGSDDAGVIVGHPSYDTIKRVDTAALVIATEDRERLWVAQTPQAFRAQVLRDAYAAAASADAPPATDDAALVERMGGAVRMVSGPRDNLKITVPEDLAVAEEVLARRGRRT